VLHKFLSPCAQVVCIPLRLLASLAFTPNHNNNNNKNVCRTLLLRVLAWYHLSRNAVQVQGMTGHFLCSAIATIAASRQHSHDESLVCHAQTHSSLSHSPYAQERYILTKQWR
jgi:hypothetical protein